MKRLLSVWITLCLCLLFAGCDKGEEISYYTDDLLLKNGINDLEYFFNSESTKDNSILYYGFRRGKEWFALFDESTKNLVKEWYGKEVSINKSDMSSFFPDRLIPEKIEENEYFLWYKPINTDIILQLIHLQANGSVKYDKGITEKDGYMPHAFFKGKGWLAHRSGSPFCIYDLSFENIIVEDAGLCDWESQQAYTGFHNGLLWMGFVDDQSIITKEYISEKPFNKKRKVHLGYGKYKEYTVKIIASFEYLPTKWGYAFTPRYYATAVDYEHIKQDVILLNDGKLIHCQLEDDLTRSVLRTWYKESVLVNNKYVISPQGEKLCEGDYSSMMYGYDFPTSYTSWMKMDWSGIRMRSLDNNNIWYASFDKQIAHDSKLTYVLLNQKGSLWSFRCDIVHFDGRKEEMKFNINIETGELTYF